MTRTGVMAGAAWQYLGLWRRGCLWKMPPEVVGEEERHREREGNSPVFFFSFFPPSSISHWPSPPKAIVKGAGKCGVREKGGWGPTWKERGNNQNKEGTSQEKIRGTSTGNTNALRERKTELS